MITVTNAELQTWIAALLWPLTRILGLLAAAPVFGNRSVPARIKVALGVLLALLIAPGVAALPALDPMSPVGLLILVQQFVIGLAMGFAMRIVFAAVELAGEVTGLTMGLGFATFFDPMTRGHSSAISQFMVMLATLVFLSANVHLSLLATLADSFNTLPISASPAGALRFNQIAAWGEHIFSAGIQLALPMIAALLVTNIALGILTRAAPQLNLFGIGFPVTISVGFVMIALALPYLATPMERLLQDGIGMVLQVGAAAPLMPR